MEPSPFLGVLLHAIGGLAAASFYVPYKQVKSWPWEAAWLLGGFFSWVVTPAVVAFLLAPQAWEVIASAPASALGWTWLFGFLWGIGGLTYGLTMRYLGIALGNAVALGMCAFFGTILPPIFSGEMLGVATSLSGQVILAGLGLCLLGIGMSGKAGLNKERELSAERKAESVAEFNYVKGMFVAVFAGAMSACMAYGFAAGKPIGQLVLNGGFVLNFLWCAYLLVKRGNWGTYLGKPARQAGEDAQAARTALAKGWPVNYFWCILAGVTWYLQFFFYGMGTTKMGRYEFSSWTLHMASIIIFATLWGIAFLEWRGTSRRTHVWIAAGLAVLILSIMVVGWGNSMTGEGVAH